AIYAFCAALLLRLRRGDQSHAVEIPTISAPTLFALPAKGADGSYRVALARAVAFSIFPILLYLFAIASYPVLKLPSAQPEPVWRLKVLSDMDLTPRSVASMLEDTSNSAAWDAIHTVMLEEHTLFGDIRDAKILVASLALVVAVAYFFFLKCLISAYRGTSAMSNADAASQ